MWCTQRDLAVTDMMGQNSAYITQKATTAVTHADDVGRLAVDKVNRDEVATFHRAHVMQC